RTRVIMKKRREVLSRKALAVAVTGFAVGGALRAHAHHSFAAEFDAEKPVLLEGTVTKVEFMNPHSWIYIDVTGPDGAVTNWAIEGGTPNTLFRRGVTRASLPVGT